MRTRTKPQTLGMRRAVPHCSRGRRSCYPAQQGFVFWSTIHGLAVLVVDEQLPPPVLRAHSLEQLAGYATTVVLAGLAP